MEDGTIEDKVVNTRKQVVFDGSEEWTLRGTSSVRNIYSVTASDIKDYTDGNQIPNILSDRFIPVSYNDTWKPGMISRWVDYKRVVLIVSPDLDLTAFKTWLSNNPVTVEYELATPDETEFTQAQKDVIDEIIKDGTYDEVTYYSSNALVNPDIEAVGIKNPNANMNEIMNLINNLDARLTLVEE